MQLLHELPDGSRHVDWMIAQDPHGAAGLITFRLPGRLDGLAAGERLQASRIDDHGPAWLTRQGPVSGDRGTARRLARGEVIAWSAEADAWLMEVRWEGGAEGVQRLELRPLRGWGPGEGSRPGGGPWLIEVAGTDPAAAGG